VPAVRLGRIPELDLLRFVAAVAVVLYHFTYNPEWHGTMLVDAFGFLPQVTRFGFLGVHLFFMISGFVILWSSEQRTAPEFIISRVARLYPSFWVCVCLTAIIGKYAGTTNFTLKTVALNLTMIPGILGTEYVDGVYWTLFVELKFYLIISLLLITGLLKHLNAWLYVWLFALIIVATTGGPHALSSIAMFPLGALFLSGCILFVIRKYGAQWHRILALAISCGLSAWSAAQRQHDFIPIPTVANAWIIAGVIILLHCALLVISLRRSSTVPKRNWYWMGSLTYPLYLLHNRIGKSIWSLMPSPDHVWLALAIVLIAVGLLSGIVAKVVERRLSPAFGRALLRLARRVHLVVESPRLRPQEERL
jgi:peptidoglycan/LPS O-acetylase OafA/YrhL